MYGWPGSAEGTWTASGHGTSGHLARAARISVQAPAAGSCGATRRPLTRRCHASVGNREGSHTSPSVANRDGRQCARSGRSAHLIKLWASGLQMPLAPLHQAYVCGASPVPASSRRVVARPTRLARPTATPRPGTRLGRTNNVSRPRVNYVSAHIEALDDAIGAIKQRDRGLSAGEFLVSLAQPRCSAGLLDVSGPPPRGRGW